MKNKASKGERWAFVKRSVTLVPMLAAIGLLATTLQASADDCSNSCSASCYKGCTGSCMEGCTGSCMQGCTGDSKSTHFGPQFCLVAHMLSRRS